ncbi:MAG: lytic murein transglycosylase [Pseudomonadota bacterium]
MPNLPLRGLVCAFLTLNVCVLSACAETPNQSVAPSETLPATTLPLRSEAAPVPPSAVAPAVLNFDEWREQLRVEALAAGISAAVFDRAFASISLDPKVLAADSSQPEFTRPVWEYLDSALSANRVARGQGALLQQKASLDAIVQRFGVPAETLVAIWGMESNYGENIGSNSVIRSLATLAFEGRRQPFWRSQLLAALQILEQGDVSQERLIGSWAGAMGQTQFMPTTYQDHAVDFDGDGKRDLWQSAPDALASAAHYLQVSGWQPGLPWGFEVSLKKGFDYALADPDTRLTLAEWNALGVQATGGVPAPALNTERATLLLPAGHRGPAFLVLNNFRAILKYNNSTAYALAIGVLSDTLKGGTGVQGSWPREDRQLGRSERVELQELLAQHGYAPGAADGIIGANTRKAVRSLQLSLGLPPDGYPTPELLEKLRESR